MLAGYPKYANARKELQMTKFKDFGTGETVLNTEPITFKLHGEEFTCYPEVQGIVMLELITESSKEDADGGAVMVKFFNEVLKEESLKKFNDLIESKDKIVTIETLSEITSWLVEQYTNRPTLRPEQS